MLSWIHLSDWHQKGASFDRKIVRDALLEDIRNRTKISEELERLDFAIFSGDLAFSGKDTEYQLARDEFIDPVLSACGLTHDQFLIVPGNHDLDRSLAENLSFTVSKFAPREVLDESFKNEDRKGQILSPMAAYSRFVASLKRSMPLSAYGCSHVADLPNGAKVAFLCLNSAWLCGRNRDADNEVDDYGQLIVGEPQIEEALAGLPDCDLIVGILHHPFQWLALKRGVDDRVKARNRLLACCDVILHGHEHEPATYAMHGTYGNCLVIPAGSTFDGRDPALQMYANGYNYCRIDLSTADPSERRSKVHFRRFDGNRTWLKDVQTAGGESSGAIELPMPRLSTKPYHRYQPPVQQYREASRPHRIFDEPHLVDYEHPESVGTLDATILECKKGGFELCIYLHPFGQGIRKLFNNRHLLAHATSPTSPYRNVFSLVRGPLAFDEENKDSPTWKLWLASDSARGKSWNHADTKTIRDGWHHFLVRWNHDKPLLEVLLDGKAIISEKDYLDFWPKRVLTSMAVGCWQSPWREHYVDTYMARVGVLPNPFQSRDIESAINLCQSLRSPT
jgi:predicted phosphodiesterase